MLTNNANTILHPHTLNTHSLTCTDTHTRTNTYFVIFRKRLAGLFSQRFAGAYMYVTAYRTLYEVPELPRQQRCLGSTAEVGTFGIF